jgi:pyridoxal phosphate enzyme (YggS family)
VPQLSQRVASIHSRIDAAIARSALGPRPITLVAVTKYRPLSTIEAVLDAGVQDIGESRVQEALEKHEQLKRAARWHLIGNLQRNKAARAAEIFDVIHSIDSVRLLDALARSGRTLQVFLQVNVSGEDAKRGVAPHEASELVRHARSTPNIEPIGLMTMAPYSEDPEEARPHFRALRDLQLDIDPNLPSLSMGMSGDFEVAIEVGATHIRIGTAIVGERSPTRG